MKVSYLQISRAPLCRGFLLPVFLNDLGNFTAHKYTSSFASKIKVLRRPVETTGESGHSGSVSESSEGLKSPFLRRFCAFPRPFSCLGHIGSKARRGRTALGSTRSHYENHYRPPCCCRNRLNASACRARRAIHAPSASITLARLFAYTSPRSAKKPVSRSRLC